MRKELQLILAGSLFLYGCSTIEAAAQSVDPSTPESNHNLYDPTLTPFRTPSSTPIPFNSPKLLVKAATFTPYPTFSETEIARLFATSTPTEIVNPIAESCILPFEGATMDGLGFRDIIYNNGLPVTSEDGTIHRHLGLDFEGGTKGVDILQMCDGTVMFSGPVKKGYGFNLGNVVVMEYVYMEQGEVKKVYMRYAHMQNLVNLIPGSVVPKGQKIGEMGHSGGWNEEHTHLHIDLWKEEAWNRIIVDRSNGDLVNQVGYYAPAETWSDNTFNKNLLDPRKWLQERLPK